MSFVGIFVARHELSMGDVFKNLDDGSSYWVHDTPNECWFSADGAWVGEAMANEIDWDASARVDELRHERDDWRYLWRDAARDSELDRLHAKKELAEKACSRLESRDYDLTLAALGKLGYAKDADVPNAVYEKVKVVAPDTRTAKAKVEAVADEIFAFHRQYILSRRVPIAVAIYGTT